ncbi:11814_t:CDS:1 [Ambispora gerdemannii]|uniref:11814_t:CDS:1 n=1 Tax=Ambispora gerdemannii TaxID=144530 RepID=A0A9N9A2W2_9GLOM|nr:11814_t:CDS:1 [Ambispora gerdemannii]
MLSKFLSFAAIFTIFSSILVDAVPIANNNVNSVPALAAFGAAIPLLVQNPVVNKRTFNLPSLVALGSGPGQATVPVIAALSTTNPGLLKVLPLAAFPGAVHGIPALALLTSGVL